MGARRQKIRSGLLTVMFCLFPAVYYYLSPYLIIDGTIHGVVTGSGLLFVCQFVSALFVGRLYCGWVCPAAGVQDALARSNDRRILRGNAVKWVIWILWLVAIVAVAVSRKGYATVDPLYKTYYGLSVSDIGSFITYLMVLSLVVIPSLVVGKRSFCHHLCWMAPFMILGEKIGTALRLPRLTLKADPRACVRCHACTRNCPMSLDVESLVQSGAIANAECIKCLLCVDGCASHAIRTGGGKKPQ